MTETGANWRQASAQALEQALESLLGRLELRLQGEGDATPEEPQEHPEPNALEQLLQRFGLTTFERDLLLLCAGFELDRRFGDLIGRLQKPHSGDLRFVEPPRRTPDFSLALSILDDGHWSALAPHSVLRRARLIEIEATGPLASRSITIEEVVLHYLTGLTQLDERLLPFLRPVSPPSLLTTGQEQTINRAVAAWSQATTSRPPAIQLLGLDEATRRGLAAATCFQAGLTPFVLDLDALPQAAVEREPLLDLWARDAILGDLALVVELDDLETHSTALKTTRRLVERLPGCVILSGDAVLGATDRSLARVEAAPATQAEQHGLWTAALGPAALSLNGQLDRLVQQFTLTPSAIREITDEAHGETHGGTLGGEPDAGELWRACRRHARGGLDDLAQRIPAAASWDHLVLPEPQLKVLRQVATHVRQRARVYEDWGFANRSPRGLGISALFAGTSGTGKTMAAEVLAGELELDLYRIDLSATVSKYIGETEKNLRRIFDAAEASGAILLFDEADALFGKRSEVKDSHDRYANLEISYLLQRIEAYRGLAILTTNLQRNLDDAFVRRLRFILQFPHPGSAERAAIWQRIFPPQTPIDSLDTSKLARLSVTGGHIKSIALHAAVLAADDNTGVTMRHVLQAAHAEYAKLGKSLSDGEVKGWI